MSFGINLSGPVDYYGDRRFANLVYQSRGFCQPGSPGDIANLVPCDAAGYPLGDFSLLLATVPTLAGGVYQPLYDGTHGLKVKGQFQACNGVYGTRVTVRDLHYDPDANETTALLDIVVSPQSRYVAVSFTGTKRLPGDASGTGLVDVQIMAPLAPGSSTPHGFDADLTESFTTALSPFSAARFLDPNNTNFTPAELATSWAARRLPSNPIQSSYSYTVIRSNSEGHWIDAQGNVIPLDGNGNPVNPDLLVYDTYGDRRGVAYEKMIAVCNALGIDFWIPVSPYADNDHFRNLCLLVKNGSDGVNPYPTPQQTPKYAPLAPGLKFLFTFGNENWNYKFATSGANREAAVALRNAGGTDFEYDGPQNDTYLANRYCAWKTVVWRDIAAEVLGEDAFGVRFFPILESQQGGQDQVTFGFLNDALKYLHRSDYRPLNRKIWGAGCSWYHYHPVMQASSDAWIAANNGKSPEQWSSYVYPTPAEIFAVPPPDHFTALDSCFALVKSYGLHFVGYEGGEVFEQDENRGDLTAIDAVQEDVRYIPHVKNTMALTARRMTLAMVYGMTQIPWHLVRTTCDLTSPKYVGTAAGILENQGVAPDMSQPDFAPVDQAIQANSIASGAVIYTTGQVNFPAPVTIEVSFQALQSNTGDGLQLLLDSAPLAAGPFPLVSTWPINLLGDVGGGRVRLRCQVPAGPHEITLTAAQDLTFSYGIHATIQVVTTQESDSPVFDLATSTPANGDDLTALGWTHAGGPAYTWSAADSCYTLSYNGQANYQLAAGAGSDYAVEATFAYTGADSDVGGRATAGSAAVPVYAGPGGPVFRLKTPGNLIDARNSGNGTYRVGLRCVGDVYTSFCNGFEVARFTDSGAGTAGLPVVYAAGNLVGLKVWGVTTGPIPSSGPSAPTTLTLALPASSTIVGTTGTATLTLAGGPAASTDTIVALAYSSATGPASVTVPAGSLTATFSVTPTATAYTVTPTAQGLTGSGGAVAGTATAASSGGVGLTTQQAAALAQIPGLVTAVQALAAMVAALPGTQGIAAAVLAGLPSATIGHLSDKTGFALSAAGLDAITVEPGVNARQAMSPILAASAGVVAGAGTGVVVIKGGNATATRITATTDSAGNRSTVTLNLPA